MQIDPMTFAAQIFNFLVLVYLLKKFLYAPVLKAMEEREHLIASRLEEAQRREASADAARRQFESQREQLERNRTEQLEAVKREIETWRQESLRQARDEIGESRQQWRAGLQREQQRFISELRERAVGQVHQIARQALANLADVQLEELIIERFCQRLAELSKGEQDRLQHGLESAGRMMRVRSGLELRPEQLESVRRAVSNLFPQLEIHAPRYEHDSEVICGIELLAGDQKLAWNVSDYMESLEHSFSAALEHEAVHG